MATYLVTGGCGFIGSHLCDALVGRGDKVRVLDNLSTGRYENLPTGVDFTVGDVGERSIVEEAMKGVDGCFHLAAVASVAQSVEDWTGTHRTNLTGAINVFDAARETCVPVVYASSAAVYGDNATVPLSEDSVARPLTPYGADKLGCELHARVAGLIHRVPTTGFRFFNVFGPRQDPSSPYSGVISIFADRILQGVPLTIFGDGQQVRDFVYVADVVRFLLAGMAQSGRDGQVFNVCSGSTTTIMQLARTMGVIAGIQPTTDSRPARAGDIRMSLGDPAKAKRLLGISTQTDLGEGLKITMESLKRRHIDAA